MTTRLLGYLTCDRFGLILHTAPWVCGEQSAQGWEQSCTCFHAKKETAVLRHSRKLMGLLETSAAAAVAPHQACSRKEACAVKYPHVATAWRQRLASGHLRW